MTHIFDSQFAVVMGLLLAGFGAGAFFLWKLNKKISVLFGSDAAGDQDEMKENIIRRVTRLEMRADEIEPRVDVLEKIAKISVQKIGFLRFNPFQDTGGDNSFVIVLLDQEKNGIILSSLYTRDGVRVFAKKVEHGRTRYPLIDEEKKVLEEAVG